MLRENVIEVRESDYSSPVISVESSGRPSRPGLDYRKLNKAVKTDYFSPWYMDQVIRDGRGGDCHRLCERILAGASDAQSPAPVV